MYFLLITSFVTAYIILLSSIFAILVKIFNSLDFFFNIGVEKWYSG